MIDCTPSVGRAASDLKRSGYAIRKRSIDLIICLIEFRGNALRWINNLTSCRQFGYENGKRLKLVLKAVDRSIFTFTSKRSRKQRIFTLPIQYIWYDFHFRNVKNDLRDLWRQDSCAVKWLPFNDSNANESSPATPRQFLIASIFDSRVRPPKPFYPLHTAVLANAAKPNYF